MDTKKNLLTRKGLIKNEEELILLKTVKRKEVAQKIKEAREQGDLSENAEYDAAKDEQREIEERIVYLENLLKNAEVVEDVKEGHVNLGCQVTLRNLTTGSEVTYVMVGSTEASSMQKKISNESPVGKAIINKKAGDKVSVETKVGVHEFEILDVVKL